MLSVVAVAACSSTGATEETTAPSYCRDEEAFATRCISKQECRTDLKAQCDTRARFYSEGYKAAFSTCQSSSPCDKAGLGSPCVDDALKKRAPTAAQQKLADDFCAACASGAAAVREEGIACAGRVIRGSGPTLGPHILAVDDASAPAVGATCIGPAKQQFPNDYDNCENAFLNCLVAQVPTPATCK